MSRLLTFRRIVGRSSHQNQARTIDSGGLNYGRNQASRIYSEGFRYGPDLRLGMYFPNYRLYSQYVVPGSRLALSPLFGVRNQFHTGVLKDFSAGSIPTSSTLLWVRNQIHAGGLKNFSAVPQGKTHAQREQRWNRIYKRPSSSRRTGLPIKRIAQAVGLGLKRSYSSTPASFTFEARNQIRNGVLKNFPAVQQGKKLAQHAQLAWKSFYERSSGNMRTSLPIKRIAQAVSMALNRSYVVAPGIFAMACQRNVALAQAPPDADFFQPRNSIYARAQDGHVLFVSLILSAFQGMVLLLRALYLGILFSPSIAMAPFADSFGPRYRKIWLQVVHQTLERAGPAFIKWGQWAASRPDLFPSDLCAELSKLHTKAPEHSFAYTKKTIERAFGRKITEIFDDFEEVPVASGSIAQVHRASLKYRYRGREMKPTVVAVKVRHPGVGESIKRDFEIISIVARLSKFIPTLNWLRLDESVQQFAVFMMSQVDLAREAAHLSRFIYNFRSWRNVSFPKPVYPLVHPAVLVETFEQGECVSHYVDELQGHERLKSSLAHIGTHALLKMLLVDNFIHADMHPGNILVREAASKPSRKRLFKSKPHVIFLDVGMTAELSKSDRSNLVAFFTAIAQRDGRTAAESALRLSKKQNCPNPQAFIQEVKESFDFWGSREGDLIHPADCMHQLLEKVRRHRVNIDGNVCTVMVTTLVLEGWQRKLDPDYDIMHTLKTILLKADWAESLSYTIEGLMAP